MKPGLIAANTNKGELPMIIAQTIAHTPRATAVASKLATLSGCVGCTDCAGLCAALIDLLTVPDLTLKRKPA